MDFAKLKKNIEQSCNKIVNNNDYVKDKFGEDLSDTDDDMQSMYSKRNSNIIDKIKTDNSSIRINNVNKKLINIKKEIKKDSKKKKDESDSENGDESNSDDDDSDENSYEYEFQDDLQKCVVSYIKADDIIMGYNEKIKDLKKIKKNCEDEILKHLERLGDNSINVSGGKLIKNQYNDKGKPKEDLVKNMIKKNCENTIAQKIFDEIDKEHAKNKKTRTSLKRTHEKKIGKKK